MTGVNIGHVNLSEESGSEENDKTWQIVNKKRKKLESPRIYEHKRINNSCEPSTSANNNKYAALTIDDDDECEPVETIPKPPPIYIPDVQNISVMLKQINNLIKSDEFNYKSLREGQIRLMIKSIDSYRKIIKYFEESNICFHTYQLKQEKAYRIVVKGLHHSTPVEDIKAELQLQGHQVRSVFNVKSRITKKPLSMFFVDLEPNPNNQSIFDIKHINNGIVKIEPPLRTSDLVQCHRCQEFGHTKSYCKKPYKCVKCAMDHATSECTKPLDTPPRCVHCLNKHTANYKGCKVYQDLISKRPSKQTRFSAFHRSNQFNENSAEYPTLSNANNNQPKNKYNLSYSEAIKCPDSNYISRLEKLENMMENLMNMMSMIMTKLCK